MTLLKITGLALIFVGLIITAATLILAKKSGTFEAVKELGRIRSTGYLKEHKEIRGEDIYKRELATDHSRLMSRRAKRVLERMEAEEKESEKQSGIARGTSLLEEVRAEKSEATAVLPNHTLPDDATSALNEDPERTAALDMLPQAQAAERSEDTAVLGRGEDTSVLPDEERTATLGSGEQTATLTIIGDPKPAEDVCGTALLYEEGTAILRDDDTALLQEEDGTAVLKN